MTTAYFTGEASWARFKEPDKFGKYSVTLALDFKQFKEMKDLGLKNGGKPSDDGKMLVTFRRPQEKGKPSVSNADGTECTELVGNGSNLTVKIEIETFESKKHGKVTRSDMVAVKVNNLVVYNPDALKKEAETQVSSADAAEISMPPASRPKIPF